MVEISRRRYDEMVKDLKDTVGWRALKALRQGRRLNCWRRSSPYNWWVEDSRGGNLWHSSEGNYSLPLMLFEEAACRSSPIGMTLSGWSDSPDHSKYRFLGYRRWCEAAEKWNSRLKR